MSTHGHGQQQNTESSSSSCYNSATAFQSEKGKGCCKAALRVLLRMRSDSVPVKMASVTDR